MTEDANMYMVCEKMRTVHKGGKWAQTGTDEAFREEQTKEGFSPAGGMTRGLGNAVFKGWCWNWCWNRLKRGSPEMWEEVTASRPNWFLFLQAFV